MSSKCSLLDIGSIIQEEGTLIDDKDIQAKGMANQEKNLHFVTFALGTEEYGIEIHKVNDIIPVPPITPIINSPDAIQGMIKLRGELVPVMDLRQRFGLPEHECSQKSRIIIVESANGQTGLLVDHVTQVLKIQEDSIDNVTSQGNRIDQSYIRGLCQLDERLIILLQLQEVTMIETIVITNNGD